MNSTLSRIQKFQIGLILFVLSVVFISSVKLTFDGYYGFYYEGKKYEPSFFAKVFDRLYDAPPVKFFSTYTGFDTGYGFFAPNVASNVVYVFEVYDETGHLVVRRFNDLGLKTKEGNLRFETFNLLFLDKLTEIGHTSEAGEMEILNDKYLDLLVKQMTRHVKKFYPDEYKVVTLLYLHDFPSIKRYKEGERERLILIKKYAFQE